MAFDAGSLVATIRLDGVDQFNRDAQRAGRELEKTSTAGSKMGAALKAGMQGAAFGITTATAASAGYIVSLAKTGAAYNTLQQTSRAALKTIMGSAEEAAEQMSKLDDFARNSPFSKATFIQAQQQLLGFGIEAKKVIPILSAVQDATAAVGGSNDQISEIVSILAKISSAGKITAEDLNQLGDRGIDAASLLGAGFDKTAGEIRDSITKGTLDAGKAVDVLTEQMTKKYGGAAANVKETWTGTVDRINAAQREIGAALAEPFISQQGGGLAITWGNQVADVMRAVLGHVSPIVSILEGRMYPGFAALTGALDAAKVTIKTWDSSEFENFLNTIDHYAPAIAGVAGAIAGLSTGFLSTIPVIGQFVPALAPVPAALAAIALASPEVRESLSDILSAFQPLLPVAADLASTFAEGLNIVLPLVASGIDAVTDVVTPLVGVITRVPTPLLASVAAFLAMNAAMKTFQPAAQGAVDGVKSLFTELRSMSEQAAAQQTLGQVEGSASRLSTAMGTARIGAQRLGDALKTAIISNPVGLALTGISVAVAAVSAAFAASAEKTKKYEDQVLSLRGTLDETTGAATDATRALVAEGIVEDGTIDKLKELGIASNDYVDALTGVAGAGNDVRQQIIAATEAQIAGTSAMEMAQTAADRLGVSLDTVIAAIIGSKTAQEEVTAASTAAGEAGVDAGLDFLAAAQDVSKLTGSSQELWDSLLTGESALRQGSEETRDIAEATREAEAAMSDAERAAADFNTAMEIFADTTSTAAEQTNALKQALDIFNGGTKSATELERELNDQTRALADAFQVLDENGNNVANTLVDASGKIDTTGSAGSNLSKQVDSLNTSMLEAITNAENAAKANGEQHASLETLQGIYDDYTGRLRGVASEASLSEEQIQGLINTAFDMPSVIKYAIDNGGTVDAESLRLVQLAADILATPDGEFSIRNEDIPGIIGALESLGYKTEHLPDGEVAVDINGAQVVLSALGQIDAQTYNRSMTVTTYHDNVVRWSDDGSSGRIGNKTVGASANGNLFSSGYAQAFANGGEPIRSNVPSAIYKGRPRAIYKFAEDETVWEAFISGKPSMRARNQQVAKAAVARLGGRATFGPGDQGADAAFADGGILDQDRKMHDLDRRRRELRAEFLRKLDISRRNGHRDEKAKTASEEAWTRWRDADQAYQAQVDVMQREKDSLVSRQEKFYDDLRRGNIDEQGVNGGGMGLVDRLRDAGRDTGGRTGREMERQAMESEKKFLELEKAADKAAEAVSAAESRKRDMVRAAEDDKAKLVGRAEEKQKEAVKKAGDQKAKLVEQAEARGAARVKAAQAERDKLVDAAEKKGAARVKAAQDKRDKLIDAAEAKRTAAVKAAQEKRASIIDAAQKKADAKLKSETERANAIVDKATAKWTAAVDKASKKLSDLTAASETMSSGIANTIRSKLDLGVLATATQQTKTVTETGTKTVGGITLSTKSTREETVDVPVTAKSVKSGLQKQAAAAKKLAEKVKKLGAKGFSAAFINEVMSLGLEQAEPMIDALLSMSAADVKDTQSLYNTINSAATNTGKSVADRYYGDSIKAAEKQLKATESAADKAIKAAQASADKIIANAKAWGEKQVAAATKAGDKVLATAQAKGDQIVAQAKAQGDRAVETAKAQADKQIAAAKTQGDKRIAAAKADADRQVAQAKAQGDRLIANATKQGDRAIAEAKRQGDRHVAQAKAQADRQIAAAKANQDAIRRALQAETNKIKDALAKGLQNPWASEAKKKAAGGAVFGPGTGTSDSIPTMLSNGEHVWTAAEVTAAGGHSQVERIRAAVLAGRVPIRLSSGGPVRAVRSSLTPVSAPIAPTEPQYVDRSQTTVQLVPRPDDPVSVQARRALREVEAAKRRKGSR